MGIAGQFVTREGGNCLHTELLEDLGGPDIQHMNHNNGEEGMVILGHSRPLTWL